MGQVQVDQPVEVSDSLVYGLYLVIGDRQIVQLQQVVDACDWLVTGNAGL